MIMSQNMQGFQDVQQRLQHQNNLDMLQGTGSMPQQFHNMAQQQQHHQQQQQHQNHQQQQQQQHQNHQQQQQNHQQQQNQQQQQNHQSSPPFPGPGLTPAMLLPNQPFGMLPQGGSAGNGTNTGQGNSNQGNFDVNSELKRLQRLQQQLGGQGQNALLFPDSNNQMNQPPMNNQAALLQQMLDQQKLQSNNLMGNSNCFNPIFAQPGLLQDARLLLAQSQFGGGMAQGQNNGTDMPLPSPHSLFHRDGSRRMRGGVIEPFPEKLHRLLTEVEAAGRSDVISFVANGRAFAIHKPDKFFKEIVPLYFRQSRLSSFKRQLNLYGFELINTGPSRGGYFHELFVKDRPDLCRRMRRVAVKVSASKGDKEEGDHSGPGKKGGQDSTGAGDDGDLIGSVHLPTNADLLHHHGGGHDGSL